MTTLHPFPELQQELCKRGPLPERPPPTATVTRGKKSKSKHKLNKTAVGGEPPSVQAVGGEPPSADTAKPAAVKRVLVPYKYRDAKALARGYMYDMTQYCRDNVEKYLKALQLPVSSLRRAPTPFIDESRLLPDMCLDDSDTEALDGWGGRSPGAPAPTKGGFRRRAPKGKRKVPPVTGKPTVTESS